MTTNYDVAAFMGEAKQILADDGPLPEAKAAIADRLSVLSQRDDLTRFGMQLGPTDASNNTYLMWREPPYFTLLMVKFDEHFLSPVHNHGDHWIVACGYRGADRWDLYERRDGRSEAGPCDVVQVDEILLKPGDTVAMPPPPRAIHSHNNVTSGNSLELIFSAAPPTPAKDRMLFDIPDGTCRPSWYEISDQLQGNHFPPRF